MKLACIIPTLNRADLLHKQLDRDLNDFYRKTYNTNIIDNGDQGIIAPNITVTRLPKNIGVAAAWNLGVKQADSIGATHVALINDDIELGFTYEYLLQHLEPYNLDTTVVTSQEHWSFVVTSIKLIKELGYFDEKYFPAYYEDTDFKARLALHGYKHVALSKLNAKVFRNSQTIAKDPQLNKNFKMNKDRFFSKFPKGQVPTIVESILYNGEADLLIERLNYTNQYVNRWFITEWDYTFQGEEKGLSLFSDLMSEKIPPDILKKVTILVPPDKPTSSAWDNEYYCRNFAKHELSHLPDNTLITLSDLDEIPDYASILSQIFSDLPEREKIYTLDMWDQYYNTNWVFKKKQKMAKMFFKPLLQNLTPQRIRMHPPTKIIADAGWHLSYFMDAAKIRKKLMSFSHTEFNCEPYINISYIQDRIAKGEDLFRRPKNQYDLRPATEFTNYKKPPFYVTS